MAAVMHSWDERIRRARELAIRFPVSQEALTFYAGLAERQRSLFLQASAGAGTGAAPTAGSFADRIDVQAVSDTMPDLLAWLEGAAPDLLARSVAAIRTEAHDWHQIIRDALTREDADAAVPVADDPRKEVTAFLIDAVLQPYAEAAAAGWGGNGGETAGKSLHHTRCPICNARPAVGMLREAGQGAKRMLVCARCLTDWEFLRVVCPGCREERFDALPVYTADGFPHVRIEACDTCRRYLKTIDLTRDGLAVPIVDDIASVVLDLWAVEHGYRRLHRDLLRVTRPSLERMRATLSG
jgi:FdhE protein